MAIPRLKGGTKTRGMRRPWKVTTVTCPVESATSSREMRIQQGEDEGNAAFGFAQDRELVERQMGVFRQPLKETI